MNQIEKNLRMYRFWTRASERFGLWIAIFFAVVIGVFISPNENLTNCMMACVAMPLIIVWFQIDKALHKKVKECIRMRFEKM